MNKEIEKRIHEFTEQMYQAGYKDGQKDALKAKGEIIASEIADCKKAYEKGLKHGQELRAKEAECAEACGMKRAWQAVRKIMYMSLFDIDELYPGWDAEHIIEQLPAKEVIEKVEAWEEKQTEKRCINCDNADVPPASVCYECENHSNYVPKQEQAKKNCDNCKYNNREKTAFPCSACITMTNGFTMWEEKEDYVRDPTPEESKSVNDYIKSISEETGVTFNEKEEQTTTLCRKCIHAHNMHGNILTCDAVPCVIEDGHCDKYEEKQEEAEKNVESIAVWDEVEDNLGNRMVVTHIDSDGKYANADAIYADGSFRCMPLELLEKTGRRFCFQELLNAMKKDDVEEADTNENK